MKVSRAVLTLALALVAFPLAAMADNTTTWTNTGGSLSASSTGVSVSGSTVTAVILPGGTTMTGSLGTLSLSTGALVSGSLATGCMASGGGCSFSFVGSSFDISGANGGPSFNGSFTSNVTLTGNLTADGKYSYTLSGVVSGMMNGMTTTGGTTQLSITLNKAFTGGTVSLSGGATNVTVPEPGTLGLLGTGLFGLAGVLRRKVIG